MYQTRGVEILFYKEVFWVHLLPVHIKKSFRTSINDAIAPGILSPRTIGLVLFEIPVAQFHPSAGFAAFEFKIII